MFGHKASAAVMSFQICLVSGSPKRQRPDPQNGLCQDVSSLVAAARLLWRYQISSLLNLSALATRLKLWQCSSPASSATPEKWTSQECYTLRVCRCADRALCQEMPVPSRPPRRPEPPGRAAMLTGGDRLVRALQTSLVGTVLRQVPSQRCAVSDVSGNSAFPYRPALLHRGQMLTFRHILEVSLLCRHLKVVLPRVWACWCLLAMLQMLIKHRAPGLGGCQEGYRPHRSTQCASVLGCH